MEKGRVGKGKEKNKKTQKMASAGNVPISKTQVQKKRCETFRNKTKQHVAYQVHVCSVPKYPDSPKCPIIFFSKSVIMVR